LPSIPRPDVPDFEALYGQAFEDDHGLIPGDNPHAAFDSAIPGNPTQPTEDLAFMTLDDLETSAEFQQDAALLQSNEFEIDPLIEEFPPSLPPDSSCD
jgi:hypothetical protein